MNCFYCDSEMTINNGIYECFKIKGTFGHSFELNSVLNSNFDKEFRFFINRTKNDYYYECYSDYAVLFYCNFERKGADSFYLKDFSILKEIKNEQQLQHLINKLKVFT